MKIAISLPDDFAKQHGLRRNELDVTALRRYLDAHRHDNLTQQINRACETLNTSLPTEMARVARKRLLASEW